MFNSFHFSLFITFFLHFCFSNPTERLVLLDQDDSLEIKYESLLNYNQNVNLLSSKTQGPILIDSPSTLIPQTYSNSDETEPQIPPNIPDIKDSFDIGREIVYLYQNPESKENMALLLQLGPNQTFLSSLFVIAPAMYDCQKIFLFKSQIFAGCISEMDNNVQVCHLDFGLKTLSECNFYNLDYNLGPEDLLIGESLEMHLFSSTYQEQPIFVFNFRESAQISLMNRFFLVNSVRGNFTFELPIEKIILHSVQILKCDVSDSQCLWILSHRESDLLSLVSFKTERFLINRESLTSGLIKERIDHFKLAGSVLVLYELITSPHFSLRVTQINLRDMSRKEYTIEKQVEILHTDFSDSFILTLSRSHNGTSHMHFINVKTGRLFESNADFYDKNYDLNLLEYDDHDFLWSFHFQPVDSESLQLYNLRDYDSMKITFDREAYSNYDDQERSKYETQTNSGSIVINASAHFFIEDVETRVYKFQLLPSDFRINENTESILERRVLKFSAETLSIRGNALSFDEEYGHVQYFNTLSAGKSITTQIQKFLAKLEQTNKVAFTVLQDELFIFTYSNKVFYAGLEDINSEVFEMTFNTAESISLFSHFDPEISLQIEHEIVMSKFLVVLIDGRRLFTADVSLRRHHPEQIHFQELDTPEDTICTIKNGLLSCKEQSSNEILFYKYHIVEHELTLLMISILTPDLSRLVAPSLYQYSELENGSFFAIYNTAEGRELVATKGQEVIGTYRLSFLQTQNPENIHFAKITRFTNIFFITQPSEQVKNIFLNI